MLDGCRDILTGRLTRSLCDGPAWPAALAAFTGPDAAARGCAVLDSVRSAPPHACYAYLADQPRWILAADAAGRVVRTDAATGQHIDLPGRPLAALRGELKRVRLAEADPAGRFVGGWIGWLGYELGAALEGVPPAGPDEPALPQMRWAFYDAAARFDLAENAWELSALTLDGEPAAQRRLDELERRLRAAAPADDARASTVPADDWAATTACNFTRADYERAVARVKDYIAAGDIYQVNLSQRFSWPMAAGDSPGALFRRLRVSHPGWYSAFLSWPTDGGGGVQAVCSASPELFLSLVGRRVVTRPIKGTRPRGVGGAADQAAIAELLVSDKDAAELAMIVDLERNDLGRVCRYGSVRVVQPRAVESHAHVHHTVATVVGELADGRDVADLLAAAFPGGSITGAPKIRAMQIIAELEPTARSAYTGAIGYLGVDGSACLNIAIRTVLVSGGRAYLQVGGGIVADSEPSAEYDETLAKARGLVEAI